MLKEIRVPDIGAAKDVDVIEVLVKPGDKIAKETALVTLESEKASMEIPSSDAGVVKEVKMKIGDKVSEGDVIVTLEIMDEKAAKTEEKPASVATAVQAPTAPAPTAAQTSTHREDIQVPDIGTASKVDVIEVLVKPGDKVAKDAPLITLESEKASMEIPSPKAGTVESIKIKVGDKVSKGDVILTMTTSETSQTSSVSAPASIPAAAEKSVTTLAPQPSKPAAESPAVLSAEVHASPAVRRLAREFGVDLGRVTATGPKKRILKEDVQNYVKTALASGGGSATVGFALAAAPQVDFTKFGEIEIKPLNKIKKLTGANLHRNWVTIPHVTQFGEADITELENFREEQKAAAEKKGYKLTPLVFIMKAVIGALKAMPQFNSSLDASGENLVLKKYFHLGVAVDTPNGLVVPVIRDVDKKSVGELAQELAQISQKAREKGLSPADMQGSCFTISSLGGIGGTAFTPIVNAPDVAILGVSKASIKPVYEEGHFVPRLMLPLSLSYDHRVIDGADGARFIVYLSNYLSDIRTLLL